MGLWYMLRAGNVQAQCGPCQRWNIGVDKEACGSKVASKHAVASRVCGVCDVSVGQSCVDLGRAAAVVLWTALLPGVRVNLSQLQRVRVHQLLGERGN